jgi:hypothetical protein
VWDPGVTRQALLDVKHLMAFSVWEGFAGSLALRLSEGDVLRVLTAREEAVILSCAHLDPLVIAAASWSAGLAKPVTQANLSNVQVSLKI